MYAIGSTSAKSSARNSGRCSAASKICARLSLRDACLALLSSGKHASRKLKRAQILLAAEQRPEFRALDLAEVDPIAYIHGVPPCSRHAQTTESDGRRESFGKTLHAHAGAIPGLYPPLHAAAPT